MSTIYFTKRTGRQVEHFDKTDEVNIARGREILSKLETEVTKALAGKAIGGSDYPTINAFFTAMSKCVARVYLVSAILLKNKATEYKQLMVDRVHYKKKEPSEDKSGTGTPVVEFPPIATGDSSEVVLKKFFHFMATGNKKTSPQITAFLKPITELTAIVQLNQWLTYLIKILNQWNAKSGANIKVTLNPLDTIMKDNKVAHQGVLLASRDAIIADFFTLGRSEKEVSPLHTLTILKRFVLDKVIDHIIEGNSDYSSVVDSIVHDLVATWQSDPNQTERSRTQRRIGEFIEGLNDAEAKTIANAFQIPTRVSSGEVLKGKILDAVKKQAEQAKVLKNSFGVSYISPLVAKDPTGEGDISNAHGLMVLADVKEFIPIVQKYRGKRLRKRNQNSSTNELDDEEVGLSDDVENTIQYSSRFIAVHERCKAMREKSATEDDSQVALLPLPIDGGSVHLHPDDTEYFKLHLTVENHKLNDFNVSMYARRRWWWVYMLVTLMREDILSRQGPEEPAKRALLELVEFMDDPVGFATNERRGWVFTGPPGSGKTSFVRSLGVLYHLLGLYPLGTIDPEAVLVNKASDLIAAYEGQTGQRTQELFVKRIGTFMPIDEAYALVSAQDGPSSEYGQQAVDQIVSLTGEFRSLLGICLIGYSTRIIDRLIRSNEGMQRRFPRSINFREYDAPDLYNVLVQQLTQKNAAYGPPLQVMSVQLIEFFEFITGTSKNRLLVFTYKATGKSIRFEREYFFTRRSDESSREYTDRVKSARKNGEVGNLFEFENASGMVDIAQMIVKRKYVPEKLALHDVIELVRILLSQHNIVEFSSERPPSWQKQDTETSSDES